MFIRFLKSIILMSVLTSNILLTQDYKFDINSIEKSYEIYNQNIVPKILPIFLDKYFENLVEANPNKKIVKDSMIKIDMLSFKTVPVYRIVEKKFQDSSYRQLELDSLRMPERCFVYYQEKFYGWLIFRGKAVYYFHYFEKDRVGNIYKCLSQKEMVIFICNIIGMKYTIKNHELIDSFYDCGLKPGYKIYSEQKLIIDEIFNIGKKWPYNKIKRDNCYIDIDNGPVEFYK
ncbi:MAG: hypothetical protein NT007_16340 [Candidatus Kapabacteria bacterium]|nr:hypothetical protein [Candidatus Kapabacteria bacterium]